MSRPISTFDFDFRNLRGLLASRRVTHKRFAAASGLNACYISRVLNGHVPGELAQLKIERGIVALASGAK